MDQTDRDEQGRWKKGTASPNPSGRPKGAVGLTRRLREMMAHPQAQETFLNAAWAAAVEHGDFRFWQAIMDRLEGPIVKESRVETFDPSSMSMEQLRAFVESREDDDEPDESGIGGIPQGRTAGDDPPPEA